MIRVLVLSPSALLKAGLEAVLSQNGAVEISSPGEPPDVALVDAEQDDEEALRWASMGVPVVALGGELTLLRSGVRVVLPREARPDEIHAAVYAAAAGLVAAPASDAAALFATRAPTPTAELTPREIEVLRLLADGEPNKAIAYKLGISEHTAKYHVASILAKLNAASRAEAVAIGIRAGWIPV